MSSLNFLELFLVSNCVYKVNNFTNLFCEVNVLLPFWSLNSSSNLCISSSNDLKLGVLLSGLLILTLKYYFLIVYNDFNLFIISIFLVDIFRFSLIILSRYFILEFDIFNSYS